jgi:hypothetical protein
VKKRRRRRRRTVMMMATELVAMRSMKWRRNVRGREAV